MKKKTCSAAFCTSGAWIIINKSEEPETMQAYSIFAILMWRVIDLNPFTRVCRLGSSFSSEFNTGFAF